MSNLENLTSKILEDANTKAAEIIDKANKDEKNIIAKRVKEAEALRNEMIQKAKSEAEIRRERIISSAELQVRNKKLRAKGDIIEKVFETALERLKGMTSCEYVDLLKKYIINIDITGDEELIVPSQYEDAVREALQDINEELKNNNKLGEVKLYEGDRKASSGFIVTKNGIEGNYTFESLVSYYKDELEGDIVKSLFN